MTTSATTTASTQSFQALVNEIHDLNATQSLLGWDLETMMPEKATPLRSKMLATLSKLSHEMTTGPEMTEHMRVLRLPGMSDKLDAMTLALVREVGRDFDKSCKIPLELLQEMVETTTHAHQVWAEARANKDFKQFEPVLRKIVSLNQRTADAIGYSDSPYDALLDDYEPGLTVAQLDPLFAQLKADLLPLLKAVKTSGDEARTDFLTEGIFPADQQLTLCRQVLEAMGFDFAAGRLDLSPHPFTSGAGTLDVRLTTRVDERDVFSAVSSAMHEGGHGMYEQGINPALNRTPLASGTSLGIHESQSRLWENQVGRSKAFWNHYFPLMQEHFPQQLAGVSVDEFYAAINRVRSTCIRVESDEVTYNLHILLRYEIEKDLIEGNLNVSQVPEVWNAKMQEYLGITPSDDSQGPLQDIHWSHGSFGYFPTYTLGNLYSAQLFRAAKKAIPDLEAQMQSGNLIGLRNWLNKEVHFVGRTESADTIIQRVTGEPLNARYFTDYLWEKYGAIFNVKRP
jgi:carboxypeptidase Taq